MSEVEPQDKAMDVLAMVWRELVALRLSVRTLDRDVLIIENHARQCSELLAAEIHEADKLRAELAALRKELSERGIEVEMIGGRWVWEAV